MSKSTSYFGRQGFLYFFDAALDFFSKKFLFENGFVDAYLSLAGDKIINVRMKFISLAPKSIKVISSNKEFKEKFNSLLLQLQSDTNKDIATIAKDVYKNFKKYMPKDDPEDKAKEEAEENLLAQEKEVTNGKNNRKFKST